MRDNVLAKKGKPILNKKFFKILDYLFWIFYICFIFLWFKDNIHPLKKINVSYLIPFIPLIGLTFFKLYFKIKYKRIKIQLRFNKIFLAGLFIILIAICFRLPWLVHNFGMVSSDEAIPALMGKHISEGKVHPIYYYGQMYMGSLSQHFFAFMFLIFGYSIFLLKLSTLIFYLAFILIQFIFIKEIFSFGFSLLISLFYCLPFGYLINVSFDNTGTYSLVLLLGSSLIYMSYLIYYKNRNNLIPFLGFLMGISFWTHQITACFILTSLVIVVLKIKLHLKRYLVLFFFSLIGSLPLLMNEILERFQLLRFLFSEKMEIISLGKVKSTVKLSRSLLSLEAHYSSYIFLVLLLLGFLIHVYFSLKKGKLLPQSMYSLFFIIFYLMYLFSRFSNIQVIRYLYPLYFCVPVLLLSIFLVIKPKIKYFFMLTLILILFFFYNLKENYSGYLITRAIHRYLNQVITSLEETGKRYWRGDYWTSYLIAALAKEKVIIDSYTVNRYYPYRLFYYNQSQNDNFIFLRGPGSREREYASNLTDLLNAFNINFKKKTIGDCWLIYEIESPVFLSAFFVPVPSSIPDLKLNKIKSSRGYLNLFFRGEEMLEDEGFRIQAEIKNYSTAVRRFSPGEKEVRLRIPFPQKKSFEIEYYLDYRGLRIQSSAQHESYSPSVNELRRRKRRREEVIYLSGFGPKGEVSGKRMRVCEKEVKFEINKGGRREYKVRLHLYSPFEFLHPYWYGEYFQQVKIEVNNQPILEKILNDGENVIEWEMRNSQIKRRANMITLKFKYHLPFRFAPFWKTSALLDKIKID